MFGNWVGESIPRRKYAESDLAPVQCNESLHVEMLAEERLQGHGFDTRNDLLRGS